MCNARLRRNSQWVHVSNNRIVLATTDYSLSFLLRLYLTLTLTLTLTLALALTLTLTVTLKVSATLSMLDGSTSPGTATKQSQETDALTRRAEWAEVNPKPNT